jgi:hypothetical protein
LLLFLCERMDDEMTRVTKSSIVEIDRDILSSGNL